MNWSELPLQVVREGVARKVFTGEGATLSMNYIDPGHKPSPHSHIHEQLVYILQGSCDFHIDGVKHPLSAGGLLAVPPNVEHYIEVTGDEQVINLDIFTPKREDYL